MRGTVAIVATLGVLAGCGLAEGGLLAPGGGDGGVVNGSVATKPSSPDATVPTTPDGAASPPVDATTPDDAPSMADAPGTDSSEDAGIDAACPPPASDASVSAATSIAPAPTIDGNLADWGCTSWIALNDKNAANVMETGQKISGEYAVRWDAMNLYVAAHIVVPTLEGTNTADPYENDAIEIYASGDAPLTGDYDKNSHQYVVDWHNDVVDYGPLEYPPNQATTNPPHFTSAVKVVADGWQVETAIAWPALVTGKAPGAGATIGLDVAFDDGDGTALKTQLLAVIAPHSISCGCTSCCCGEVSPDPDMPNCDTLCFAGVTLQ